MLRDHKSGFKLSDIQKDRKLNRSMLIFKGKHIYIDVGGHVTVNAKSK